MAMPDRSLQEVERHPLAGQQRAGVALELGDGRGRVLEPARPPSRAHATRRAGSSRRNTASATSQPEDHARLLLGDAAARARAGLDQRLGRQVAGADVLGERAGDQVLDFGLKRSRGPGYSQSRVPPMHLVTGRRSAAVLPRGARPPFRVWLNGVEQEEGRDYRVRGRPARSSTASWPRRGGSASGAG